MTNYVIASVSKQRPIKFSFVTGIKLLFFDGGIKACFSDFLTNAVTVSDGNTAEFLCAELHKRYSDIDFTVMELD